MGDSLVQTFGAPQAALMHTLDSSHREAPNDFSAHSKLLFFVQITVQA